MTTDTQANVEKIIASDKVVLFMKGNRAQPQCGFSATVVEILDNYLPDYATVDVLADPSVRQAIKDFSAWPTIPQLYVNKVFVGGCDIIKDLEGKGELSKILGVIMPENLQPQVTISDEAKAALQEALVDAEEGEAFKLKISPSFEHSLSFDLVRATDLSFTFNGIKVSMDPWTASRADGLTLSYRVDKMERGFEIDNPNAPKVVGVISAHELAHRLEDKDGLVLIDVRTQEEWDEGHIAEARLLISLSAAERAELDPHAPTAFICRSGGRSKKAADEFKENGFTEVYNVSGGMIAWNDHAAHHHH